MIICMNNYSRTNHYGMNPREEIVAAAIKAYLLSMPEVERLKVLSEITEPKVIKLHGEGGVPMPLQRPRPA